MSKTAQEPGAQILVVDDEVDHAEVMAEALRRLGHVCTIVHDLARAQDELRHGSFDLIVTDLAVIECDGQGLTLKEVAPGWTPEEVRQLTGAALTISPDVGDFEL
mgnify:CR=1 FL=1